MEQPQFHFNMDFKSMFFLLILVNTILARPQESELEDKTLCSSYFSGKKLPISENIKSILSIDNEKERIWKEDDLTYK